MSNDVAQRQYKAPPGTPSSIGPQIRTDFYQKQALIEAKKLQYFMQMADVTAMPKNYGKTIKRFHYLPLLDDRNVNDQGIDAAGNTRPADSFWEVKNSTTVLGHLSENMAGDKYTDAAAAIAKWNQLYPYGVNHDGVLADAAVNNVTGAGNLYGSSKDVGVIAAKLPALSETGGRVNRVGFRRVELEGTLEKFGFFDEYTQESLDFDTDSELMMHINREMVNGAHEMTEDALQIDLLNSAGVVRYPGAATSVATISGESGAETKLTYEDLMRVSIELDNNRTPKNTKIITGSRMIDTRVIDSARYLYIGSELIPTVKKMTDLFGNQAFIPVQQYADAGNIANGEIGSVDQFRIIVVPEMQHWAGVGGTVTSNGGYRSTSGKYDVFPMLVVGDGSFTTIGFQTNGKTVKFKIVHKKPGEQTADWHDPYGETGFMSIKWYYGFMVLRPERIALLYSLAEI